MSSPTSSTQSPASAPVRTFNMTIPSREYIKNQDEKQRKKMRDILAKFKTTRKSATRKSRTRKMRTRTSRRR